MMFALLLAAQLTKLPQVLDAPPAVYPPDRLVRSETADVACTVDIDEHGVVTQVLIEQPVAPDFDAAAVETIRRFRFSPAEIDGQPGSYEVEVSDAGEPGRSDGFALTLSNGYKASGNLAGGNIQLHTCP